ncbi:MAG: hypothetical protein R2747_05870 [Pyrinomonadaceae bacterium]
MKKTTEDFLGKHHWRIWGLTMIAVFATIFFFGVWGFFGGPDPILNSNTPANNHAEKRQSDVKGEIPAVLTDAGEFSENIYDAVKAGDWKTANIKMDELKDSAQKIPSGKTGPYDFGAMIMRLEKALAARNKTASLIEANRLTLEAANLTADYKTLIPVEVARLDFYGRELEIWSSAGDEAKLKETARLIRQNWNAIKTKTEEKGGKKEAVAFESLVVKTEAAKDPAEFAKLASPILDEVDNLERVFD